MEYEILTLSRSVPLLLRWMVTPIINRESRRAQTDRLRAMQTKLNPGPLRSGVQSGVELALPGAR